MKEKKYTIVTITAESNYGNRLQNYAMEHVVKKCDNSVTTLSNRYNIYKRYSLKEKAYVLYKLLTKKNSCLFLKRTYKFWKFDKLNISRLLISENEGYYSKTLRCKKVICGSDQIWNLDFFAKYREQFFAKFVSSEKRIAFSASIGTETIPEKYVDFFKKSIMEFKDISVREERAAEIIKELTGRVVPVTVDPTLLLGREEWINIARKPSWIKGKKFILTYFLGEISEQVQNYIQEISNYLNVHIVNLYSEYENVEKVNPQSFCAGPDEFVWLVANCEVFLTDSFHGCVFSTIFQKPFRWFSREEKGVRNMNSRMDTLFSKLQIGDWCIGNINEPVEHILYNDFSKVEKNLNYEKEYAMNYLKGALYED